MTSSIRIKLGSIEVDYEGSEDFLREELPALLSALAKVHRESNLEPASPPPPAAATPSPEDEPPPEQPDGFRGIELTTANIAAKLSVTTGSELVMAAAAHLDLVEGQERFTRRQLLVEMQTATRYYKKTFSNNLSSSLSRLLEADELREGAKDTYSLSSTSRDRLRGRLA